MVEVAGATSSSLASAWLVLKARLDALLPDLTDEDVKAYLDPTGIGFGYFELPRFIDPLAENPSAPLDAVKRDILVRHANGCLKGFKHVSRLIGHCVEDAEGDAELMPGPSVELAEDIQTFINEASSLEDDGDPLIRLFSEGGVLDGSTTYFADIEEVAKALSLIHI